MTCAEDCRYASRLVTEFGDWFWCNRPGAGVRVVRLGRECRHFRSLSEHDQSPRMATGGDGQFSVAETAPVPSPHLTMTRR